MKKATVVYWAIGILTVFSVRHPELLALFPFIIVAVIYKATKNRREKAVADEKRQQQKDQFSRATPAAMEKAKAASVSPDEVFSTPQNVSRTQSTFPKPQKNPIDPRLIGLAIAKGTSEAASQQFSETPTAPPKVYPRTFGSQQNLQEIYANDIDWDLLGSPTYIRKGLAIAGLPQDSVEVKATASPVAASAPNPAPASPDPQENFDVDQHGGGNFVYM